MIIFLMIFITVNYMLLDNVAKIVTLYVFLLMTYKILFKNNITQCAIASLISYFLLIIGEIIFIIALTVLHKLGLISNIDAFAGSTIANILISIIALSISFVIKRMVNKTISKVKENNKFGIVFTFIGILIAIGSLLYKMDFNDWKFDYTLIMNIIIILCFIYIGIIIIKQYLDKIRIGEDYEKYLEYSKQTEKLVEQYSISQHENKNELIIIKSMVHKNNTKLLGYLDEIITSKDNIDNAWIRYLRYIPFGGLKGMIHNKVSIMLDQNINVFVNVGREVLNSCLKDLNMKENVQLSKIIGVFLDNAREASLLSCEKEVSICIYMDTKRVVFEIANTYADSININKIYDCGHSTKGKNRGYGLPLVKMIVDESNIFENTTELQGQYFIQKLVINKQKTE